MSRQTHPLEVEKCVLSRLWYTSLIVYQANNSDRYFPQRSNTDVIDFVESTSFINSLTNVQNEDEHLWITHVLLNKLVGNVVLNHKHVHIQRNRMQMAEALQFCNVPMSIKQELLLLYETNSEHETLKILEKIADKCILFFKENVHKHPALICWIINELLFMCLDTFSNVVRTLQDFYFSVVKELLESHSLEYMSINDSKCLKSVLCIISKMNIIECKATELSTWLFPILLKMCNITDVELALYSRKEKILFKEWCLFMDKTYARSAAIDTLNNVLKIQKVLFRFNHDKGLFINSSELLQRIIKTKTHWFTDILNICYILLMNGKYDRVSSILSCELLKNTWLVLVFKVLNDCPQEEITSNDTEDHILICDSIKFLIKKCNFDGYHDAALNELQTVLNKHIKVVESIVKWKKESLMTRKFKEIQENNLDEIGHETVCIKHIFYLLQQCDVLSVLKAMINLHEQDYSVIQNLLKELGESENVFQAYSSMLCALKAISLCDSYNTNYKIITHFFSDMKTHLQTLYPLSFRLEVIENIFSLLFLRHEDFNFIQNNSDEDTTYTADENTKFESKPVDQCLTGFICNKYAIRDMLHHLRESILTAGIEHTKIKKETGNIEAADDLKKISSITAPIIDAKWRLELYTNSQFVDNVNSPEDLTHDTIVTNKSEVLSSGSRPNSSRMKENQFFYQVDSASDETKIRSDSSSESGLAHNNTKWRKRSKSTPLIVDALVMKDISQRPFFINFMLAPRESLIIQCLWKGDYLKAQEIIKLADMKNTQLNGEVKFSKALQAFKEGMYKHIHTMHNQHVSIENSPSSTFQTIKLAAFEGVQSSRHTSQLETFLASQEVNLRMLSTDPNDNEMLTLCVLDLALTTSQVCAVSNNLFDVAMKYLKLCRTLENTEHAHFFNKIYQQLYENKDKLPVTDILCDANIPLTSKDGKEKTEFWLDVPYRHFEFKDSQANKDTINKILKENNYLPGLKVIRRIIGISPGTEKYLQNVCLHLQLLHTIIPTDDVIITVSDLLRVPLHYYFGYQIFDLRVEPSKLESTAQTLQVNLVYSILINACPKLSNEKVTKSNVREVNGCVVLNLNKNLNKSDLSHTVQGPNQCISEILNELVQILHDLNISSSIISSTRKLISENSNVQAVLSKTSRLASLDLSELSVGDETLTFFLNTWNLMFLHASLTIWADHPPTNNLQHTVSLMSVGYLIGDLGLVTLAALRSKLLGNVISDNTFFTQIEELNEPAWQDLDVTYDVRVIFAMANEFYGSPRIRVYDTKSLNVDLTDAFYEYLDHYSLDLDKERIILLPDMVQQYQTFVSQNCKNTDGNNSENLFSVEDYFKQCDKNAVVQYITPSYTYDIILKYTNHSRTDESKNIESSKTEWQNRDVRSSLLQYLEGHCWILSYLLQRIHNENPTILENNCDNQKRIACLENLLNSSWIAEIKPLFHDNKTVAAVYETMSTEKLWSYFEVALKDSKWFMCLNLLNVLPDNLLVTCAELQCFQDKILSHVVAKKEAALDTKILQYLYQIRDVHILAQTILYNISKWRVHTSEHALLHALHHRNNYKLPIHCKLRMKEILHRVQIFYEMLPYYAHEPNCTWYDVMYCTEKIDPFLIIKSLINAGKFELCLEWLECQAFSLEIHSSITQDFLMGLLKSKSQNFKQALKLLQALPLSQSVKMCKGVLKKLESIDSLQFIANYLLEHCKAVETIKYRRTLTGIEILRMIEPKERPLYIHLIKEPLLILEQLLMNCKFESIQKILNKMSEKLEQVDICISSFDKIIRFYAQRSLDCRVSLQRDGMENKSRNVQHTVSETESTEFVMPIVVPTKEEWVPNDKARECSCCKTVIFSMFNRRHHCRRCGRVICAVCSQHRMQVPSYPQSVPVRVCDDCKRQTALQMRGVQGTPTPSEMFDYWRLTKDQTHNQTIREEFSFEYAPNISLCLAILNLHSDHKTYASFLLDRCDEMKRLLQPVSGGKVNPEVDHTVIIKMIRSLLVAAKVKCAKLGLNTGLTHCDSFLTQVDLIAILVQSDCLDLIPSDDDLGEHTLRKLRDLLIDKEQWTLALDVSTKAGLDTQGVWATWGKACLKTGYFDQARDKFFHCLDKIQHEDSDDWVLLSYPKESTPKRQTLESQRITITETNDESASKRTEFVKNRPLKDPPLLTEILQILNNIGIHRQYIQHFHHKKFTVAQGVLRMSQGQFSKHTSSVGQSIYYHESLYYLLTYGSYNSILEFFLKHDEFDKCLDFALENDLEPDLFFNAIYLYSLKNGSTDKLHEAMKTKDASLLIWKQYLLHICQTLERKQYLHILYQLQLFMKDSVRAAMMCIRFYVNEAKDYTDLCFRGNLLLDAQEHLESELQVEILSKKRRKSTCSMHSGQGILTMEMEPLEIDRHINTISRQMEITKFLGNCEKEGRAPTQFLTLFPDVDCDSSHSLELPTLFGNQQQKIHLAVLAILCGRDIEEGFGIAFRIMQDYNLPQQKVHSLAGHVLALKSNISAIEQLIKCCHTSGTPNSYVISDYVLTHCVKLLLNRMYNESGSVLKNQIDSLVRLITNIELKINAYIECKQLKAAYLLAVKHSRAQDIRKILKESDRLGQNAIKAICTKWLQQEPKY